MGTPNNDYWDSRRKAEKKNRKENGPLFEMLKFREEYYEDSEKENLSKEYAEIEVKILFNLDSEKQMRELRNRVKEFVKGFSRYSEWEEAWQKEWDSRDDEE